MVGPGWLPPAALVSAFVVLVYVPGHHKTGGGLPEVAAAGALLYVLALSLVIPRVVRGAILRIGGSADPIVLLGRGPDATLVSATRARWRLAALLVGTLVSLGATILAALLAASADQTTYAHAVASLAAVVNAAIATNVLVPAPGFAGWATLLAAVDARGVAPDARVARASRLARSAGVPFLLVLGMVGLLAGDPMLLTLAVVLAFFTWTQSELAARQDATMRFLALHRAGDLARPVTSRADPDEPVGDVLVRRPTRTTVTIVETATVLGAIGPRQLAGVRPSDFEKVCRDVMAPLAALQPIVSSAPAADVLPRMGANGFALVWTGGEIGYVEATDLATQIRVWVDLQERGRRPRRDRTGGGAPLPDRPSNP